MKFKNYFNPIKSLIIANISICLIITSCTEKNIDSIPDIKESNMDFKKFEKKTFKNVCYELPINFEKTYLRNFVTKPLKSVTLKSNHPDIYFSIENYNSNEVADILQTSIDINANFSLFHDYYFNKRFESLTNPYSSIKKWIPRTQNKTIFQTVDGENNDGITLTYFTSSIKVNSEIYIIQLIGSKEIMQYIYDDFMKILKSVKKTK